MRSIRQDLATQAAAAKVLRNQYHVPKSLADDFTANCGLVQVADMVREFLNEFPEYQPGAQADESA